MKTIDLLMDELRSMESEHQLRYESLCRLLNYWYPILGYDSANEMSYPAWGDSRARPAPYIAQLEAALVEEAAKAKWYREEAYNLVRDEDWVVDWEVAEPHERYREDARALLLKSGILLNVDKLQNGSN